MPRCLATNISRRTAGRKERLPAALAVTLPFYERTRVFARGSARLGSGLYATFFWISVSLRPGRGSRGVVGGRVNISRLAREASVELVYLAAFVPRPKRHATFEAFRNDLARLFVGLC